jgi:hypothetical protein
MTRPAFKRDKDVLEGMQAAMSTALSCHDVSSQTLLHARVLHYMGFEF